MGKKHLKSNRHKKLKAVDPFYTGERKLLLDKGIINANQAPKKDEEDIENQVTGKLKEYLDLKDRYDKTRKDALNKINSQSGSVRKKRQAKRKAMLPSRIGKEVLEENKKPDEKGAEVPIRPVPKLERMPFESDAAYLNRIEIYSKNVINRSKYETQFDVKLENGKDGKVVVKKEKKMSEKKRRRLDKLKAKIKHKKMNIKMEAENKKKQEVKFGEVVDAPPEITKFPKKRVKNVTYTIPPNQETKHGLTEKDRNQVIERYRMLKRQGKFN